MKCTTFETQLRSVIDASHMAKKKQAKRATKTAKPYQVFVSHATADKWIAKSICSEIESTGATTFRDDRDICGGDDIPEEIRRQIKQSRKLVVLLTPDSVDRRWVILEVGAAWGWSKRMRITVVMCHVTVDPIPEMIKNKRAMALNEIDNYVSELAHRVRGKNG
jgi:predicted nucleotide-binding protein